MAINRLLPSAQADTSAVATPQRTDTYGGAYVSPFNNRASADEGTYFLVNTTTPGTGVAGHAAPVAADLSTKPLILLFNGGNRPIAIDFVKCRVTAVGAGASTTDFDSWIDQSSATRYSSGAIAVTPVNCNSSASVITTGAVVYFGAVVTVAAVAAKRVGHSRVRSVVSVVEDQYFFDFGAENRVAAGAITSGTLIGNYYVPMAPVVIQPGGNWLFVEWAVSQSGAHSFDLELGYRER